MQTSNAALTTDGEVIGSQMGVDAGIAGEIRVTTMSGGSTVGADPHDSVGACLMGGGHTLMNSCEISGQAGVILGGATSRAAQSSIMA